MVDDPRRGKRRERGSASVELAVLLPVVFLLLLGVVDFGRASWTKNALSNIAREATRYASVRSVRSQDPATSAKVAGMVVGQAGPLDPDLLAVTTNWTPTNQPGNVVQVGLTYPFEPIVPLFGIESIELSSSSQMIISY